MELFNLYRSTFEKVVLIRSKDYSGDMKLVCSHGAIRMKMIKEMKADPEKTEAG